jgi:protein-disulfide isomerase
MIYRNLSLGLLVTLFVTSAAQAQSAPAPLQSVPAPAASPVPASKPGEVPTHPDPDQIGTLKIFKSQNAKIDYLGRKFGLDGWLISKDAAVQVVYTTPDGQGTVVGLLYGPDGQVATGDQLIKAKENGVVLPVAAGVDPAATMQPSIAPGVQSNSASIPPSERLWKAMESSTYMTFGPPSAPPLYVFMDPRCHYCHDYFQTLSMTYLPQNSVQLRVVPVGILSADSEKEAQQIMSTSDPKAAWVKVENGDLSGLPDVIAPGVQEKVDANKALMGEWSLKGTPGSVYRGKDGKVKLIYGLPSDIPAVIADLAK